MSLWVESRRGDFGSFSAYSGPMRQSLKRLFLVTALIWFVCWAYVGWRGWDQTKDAEQLINGVEPGRVSPLAYEVLEAGHRHLQEAMLWGVLVPLVLLVIGWIGRPWLRQRRGR
jgi:hypothetical protein